MGRKIYTETSGAITMMKLTSMHLPDDMRTWLAEERKRTGAAIAEIVRRAVVCYMIEREEEASKPTREPRKARRRP
jgi:hypothetical protein